MPPNQDNSQEELHHSDEERKLDFSELERLSDHVNSNSSVPLTQEGADFDALSDAIDSSYPDLTGKDQRRIRGTAIGAFLLNTGRTEFAGIVPSRILFPTPYANEILNSLTWEPAMENLRSPQVLTEVGLNRSITKLVESVESLLNRIGEGKKLYSPFFADGYQIEITSFIEERALYALQILKGQGRYSFDLAYPATVTGQMAKGFKIPVRTPANYLQSDFDSGMCSILPTTSFRLGDECLQLTRDDEWALVAAPGQIGFVPLGHLSYGSYPPLQDVYYIGQIPITIMTQQGRNTVLLPSDRLVQWKGSLYVPANVRGRTLGVSQVSTQISAGSLTLELSSPAELFRILQMQKAQYVYPNCDCSSFIRDGLRMAGFKGLRRYSGDIIEDMKNAGLEEAEIHTLEELGNIKDGLYVTGLLQNSNSRHLYITLVAKGEMISLSQAFNIEGDGGMEYPIGNHQAGKNGLVAQLDKGRQLRFMKLAGVR